MSAKMHLPLPEAISCFRQVRSEDEAARRIFCLEPSHNQGSLPAIDPASVPQVWAVVKGEIFKALQASENGQGRTMSPRHPASVHYHRFDNFASYAIPSSVILVQLSR